MYMSVCARAMYSGTSEVVLAWWHQCQCTRLRHN